ncbi:MAG: ceramidase domain-containing protein [Desulfobulbaceae bacterium]
MRRIVPVLLLMLCAVAIGSLYWHGPIPQDPAYHDFADQRSVFGIPNFWNVVSNLPFVLVGLLGLSRYRTLWAGRFAAENGLSYLVFFAAILCTSIGSGYYHLRPDNWSLAWDRMAMALSFMAFLSIIIGEYVSTKLGRLLLLPLCLTGLLSVLYWIGMEQIGAGDLRPYAIIQFLPMPVILVIVFFWKSATFRVSDVLIIGAGYGLAKVLEILDAQTYQLVMVSGHSLKHLAAAFSASWLLVVLARRGKTDQDR